MSNHKQLNRRKKYVNNTPKWIYILYIFIYQRISAWAEMVKVTFPAAAQYNINFLDMVQSSTVNVNVIFPLFSNICSVNIYSV